MILNEDVHQRGADVNDVREAVSAEVLGEVDEGGLLGGGGLLVDDEDGLGGLGIIEGESGGALDSGGDRQSAEILAVPAAVLDLPGHDGLMAGEEDLSVGEAGAGEDVGGAGFDIVALDADRFDGRRDCRHHPGTAKREEGGQHWVSLLGTGAVRPGQTYRRTSRGNL